MYSQDKIDVALKVYHQCGSVTTTIRVLGYPARSALYTWIANERESKSAPKEQSKIHTGKHPRNPPLEVKMDAIYRCFERKENIKSVCEDIGYTRASIYSWRKKYLQGGTAALLSEKNRNIMSVPDMAQLQEQIRELQVEIAVLKETVDVLKKLGQRAKEEKRHGL